MTRYGKLCTEFYDLDKPEAPIDALEFYRGFARAAVGPVLEPMCGSGRFLLPLLADGVDIEGADSSTEMIAACAARGRAFGLSPKVHQQNVERLELSRQFGLVFVPSGSFCLLTDEQAIEQSLRRLHAALLPGGKLLVEVERVPHEPPQGGLWGGRWVERPDGAKIVMSWLSDYSGVQRISRSVHRYELIRNGRLLATEYEDFEVRFYERDELEHKLASAGFMDIEAWKPYELSPADDTDDAIVFSCTK
jgi:hypothetical protein